MNEITNPNIYLHGAKACLDLYEAKKTFENIREEGVTWRKAALLGGEIVSSIGNILRVTYFCKFPVSGNFAKTYQVMNFSSSFVLYLGAIVKQSAALGNEEYALSTTLNMVNLFFTRLALLTQTSKFVARRSFVNLNAIVVGCSLFSTAIDMQKVYKLIIKAVEEESPKHACKHACNASFIACSAIINLLEIDGANWLSLSFRSLEVFSEPSSRSSTCESLLFLNSELDGVQEAFISILNGVDFILKSNRIFDGHFESKGLQTTQDNLVNLGESAESKRKNKLKDEIRFAMQLDDFGAVVRLWEEYLRLFSSDKDIRTICGFEKQLFDKYIRLNDFKGATRVFEQFNKHRLLIKMKWIWNAWEDSGIYIFLESFSKIKVSTSDQLQAAKEFWIYVIREMPESDHYQIPHNIKKLIQLSTELMSLDERKKFLLDLRETPPPMYSHKEEMTSLLREIGKVYVELQDYTKAEEFFMDALLSNPENNSSCDALYELGMLFLQRNDCEIVGARTKAKEYFLQAHRKNPNDVPTLEKLAEIYTFLNEYDEAKKILEQILKINPKNGAAEFALERLESLMDGSRE